MHIPHADSGIDMTLESKAGKQGARETSTTEDKARGDFFAAWGGISSVGLGLPILHSAASSRSSSSLSAPTITDIVRLCSQATAAQVGLSHRKGALRAGMDADVCVFDDAETWMFSQGDMRWRNRCSPWEGHEFTGRVKETWVRGQRVFELGGENGGFVGMEPGGGEHHGEEDGVGAKIGILTVTGTDALKPMRASREIVLTR